MAEYKNRLAKMFPESGMSTPIALIVIYVAKQCRPCFIVTATSATVLFITNLRQRLKSARPRKHWRGVQLKRSEMMVQPSDLPIERKNRIVYFDCDPKFSARATALIIAFALLIVSWYSPSGVE